MSSIETIEVEPAEKPSEGNVEENARDLQDALADFENAADNPKFRLKEGDTIKDYFNERQKENTVVLAIPLPSAENEDEIKRKMGTLAHELRRAIFSYLEPYLDEIFKGLSAEERNAAIGDIRIVLGEKILNLRHAKETDAMHHLFIRVSKLGDTFLVVKTMNPTNENVKDMEKDYCEDGLPEHGMGKDIVEALSIDKSSKVERTKVDITNPELPVIKDDKIVGVEDAIIIGPQGSLNKETVKELDQRA